MSHYKKRTEEIAYHVAGQVEVYDPRLTATNVRITPHWVVVKFTSPVGTRVSSVSNEAAEWARRLQVLQVSIYREGGHICFQVPNPIN